MALNTSKPTSAPQELIEEGLYPARLVRIIEIGDQEDKYGVKSRVVFAFTIPSQTIEIDGEQKQRMFMTFPLNNTANPDSTTAKYIKAFGADLDKDAWNNMLGKPCMLEISNKVVNGVTRQNITNVVKPMAGVPVAEPDCDVFIFDFENPDKKVFDKLSDFRKDQIKQAVNYEGSAVEKMLDGKAGYQQPTGATDDKESEDSPI